MKHNSHKKYLTFTLCFIFISCITSCEEKLRIEQREQYERDEANKFKLRIETYLQLAILKEQLYLLGQQRQINDLLLKSSLHHDHE